MILSLDPDGAPLAPRRVLYEGKHSGYGGPSVISVGDSIYVALTHAGEEVTPGREGVYLQRWRCTAPAPDPCEPQAAEAGDCAGTHVWGWRWTGTRCEAEVGCASDCIGADCGALSQSRHACEAERTECLIPACAPSSAALLELCIPSEILELSSTSVMLSAWVPGCECEPPPTCRVSVSAERELTVSLESCAERPPGCDCSAIDPVEGTVGCVLPPLARGEWTVRVADEAFPVRVRAPWETLVPESDCRSFD